MLSNKEFTGLAMLLGVSKKAAALYYSARVTHSQTGKGLVAEVVNENKEMRASARELLANGWLVIEGKTKRKSKLNSDIYVPTPLSFERDYYKRFAKLWKSTSSNVLKSEV
jgi:hypothetical protein